LGGGALRIDHIATFFGVTDLGGAEISIKLLMEKLAERGHDVRILTTRKHIAKDASHINTVTIPRTSWIPKEALYIPSSTLYRLLADGIMKEASKTLPDVFHVQDACILPAATDVAGRLMVPIVATIRDNVLNQISRMKFSFPVCVVDWKRHAHTIEALKRVDAIISVSRYIKRELESVGIEENKIHPIYNLSPTWKVEDDLKRHNPDSIRLFAPGRLFREKGFTTLIEALRLVTKKVEGVELIVAGDGPEKKRLIRLAYNYGLEGKVRFLGRIPNRDMARFYSMSDIAMLASIHPEPLSRIPLEAMKCRKPIIATNTGGSPEVVMDGINGILVPPNDPVAMAEAILKLIRDVGLRRAMGRRGWEVLKRRFDPDRLVDETLKVYESVISGYRDG
jgi:glycosyltransferase involved in cell wall biosynthesis